MASRIHPERLPDLDLMDEVNQFFGQMYGMDEGSISEYILPALKGDLR
jgi:hypothetical protein